MGKHSGVRGQLSVTRTNTDAPASAHAHAHTQTEAQTCTRAHAHTRTPRTRTHARARTTTTCDPNVRSAGSYLRLGASLHGARAVSVCRRTRTSSCPCVSGRPSLSAMTSAWDRLHRKLSEGRAAGSTGR